MFLNSVIRGIAVGTVGMLMAASPAVGQGLIGTYPNPPTPTGNPANAAIALVGKALFHDELLSSDRTMACSTCHASNFGGNDKNGGARHPGNDGIFNNADDEFGSPGMVDQDAQGNYIHNAIFGVKRQATNRNAPTQIGAAFFDKLFWDMRAGRDFKDLSTPPLTIPGFATNAALEDQAAGPPISNVEMSHAGLPTTLWADIETRIANARILSIASNIPASLSGLIGQTYTQAFTTAFGSGTPTVTRQRIAMALAQYMRTLVPNQAPIDLGINALTPGQRNGFLIFRANGCTICHATPTGGGATNAAGQFIVANDTLFTDGQFHNIGLAGHSRFVKTPTLRNVGLHKRFFSSGQFGTLADTFTGHYNNGVTSPPFGFNPPLTGQNLVDVLAFLGQGLTDPRVANSLPPFDQPTLRSEVKPFGSNLVGTATVGSGNATPTIIGNSPEHVGNSEFKIGLGTALSGSSAILGVANFAVPNQNINGIILNLDATSLITTGLIPVNGSGAGTGTATFFFPIPNNPALVGTTLAYQWFVLDPLAPAGLACSQAATYTVF